MAIHPYTRLFPKTTDPTVNDDSSLGYELGDTWINESSGAIFQCVDPTDTAAVWNELGGGAFDLAAAIHGATGTTPAMGDEIGGADASASFGLIKFTAQDLFNIYVAEFETDPAFDAALGVLGYVKTVAVDSDDGEIVAFNGTNGNQVKRGNVLIADLLAGWKKISQTWTYASADDPVYQIYVSGDVTANADYKLGNKVKCTNNSTTFYGYIVKVGAYDSGNNRTPVDLYGGSNYDLANSAITLPYISKIVSPDGFPLDRRVWDRETVTSNAPAKASPAGSTWYGGALLSPTGPSIDIPIGLWDPSFEVTVQVDTTLGAAGAVGSRATLSTANNSESDPEFSASCTITLAAGTVTQRALYTKSRSEALLLTSKTTYYLNIFTGSAATTLSMNPGSNYRNIIRARFLYF